MKKKRTGKLKNRMLRCGKVGGSRDERYHNRDGIEKYLPTGELWCNVSVECFQYRLNLRQHSENNVLEKKFKLTHMHTYIHRNPERNDRSSGRGTEEVRRVEGKFV